MSLATTIKNYIKTQCDMDMVGIASAEALRGEPEGHRPGDLLPGATCVIVFGRKIQNGVIQSAFRVLENKMRAAHSCYQAYGSELAPNILILNETFNISAYLEENFGATAMPLAFGSDQNAVWRNAPAPSFADPLGQGFPLDIGKAAMAAGLGEFGWSNRFVTKENGPRQILGAVITDLPLDCDAPYDGPRLCDPAACRICSRVCPTGAIPSELDESKEIAVEGRSVRVAALNPNACTVASAAYRQEYTIFAKAPDLIEGNSPSDEELKAAFAKKPMHTVSVDHYPKCYCDKCMLYCPLGNWEENFGKSGLSGFKESKPV